MTRIFPQRALDPIAAGGSAIVPQMNQPENIGKAMFFDQLQEQKAKKQMQEQQAMQKFEGTVKGMIEGQKTAWQQDIPAISKAVNELSTTYAEMKSKGIDPFNAGKHPEAFQKFYEQAYNIESMIAASRQDKTFYDIAEKKAMDPNYMNEQNQANLDKFKPAKIFERERFKLQYNYNEPKFIKEISGAVRTTETETIVPGKEKGVNEKVTVKAPDPQSLAETAISVLTKSTGPQPEAFRNAIAQEVAAMSQDQLLENAISFIEMKQGSQFDDKAREEIKAELVQNEQALMANAALGRSAIKIGMSMDTKSGVSRQNDPKWMFEQMYGAKNKAQATTTFGVVTQTINDAWSQSAADPEKFLESIAKNHGIVNKNDGVTLRVPTDAKPMLLPTGTLQVGIARPEDTMPYGSFSEFEVVYGYYNPKTKTVIPMNLEQAKDPANKAMGLQPFIRVKFLPAKVEQYTGKVDIMGNKIVNPKWTELMNQGIDPTAINRGVYFGQSNFMYFDPNSDTDRNMLNSFVRGTTTAYGGQKATESNMPNPASFMSNDYDW